MQGGETVAGRGGCCREGRLLQGGETVAMRECFLPPPKAAVIILPDPSLSSPSSRSPSALPLRRLHAYAHGGFMGAAISMLADPEWEHILMEALVDSGSLGKGAAAKVGGEERGTAAPWGRGRRPR